MTADNTFKGGITFDSNILLVILTANNFQFKGIEFGISINIDFHNKKLIRLNNKIIIVKTL